VTSRTGIDKLKIALEVALMLLQVAAVYGALSYRLGRIETQIEAFSKTSEVVAKCQERHEERIDQLEANVKLIFASELRDEKHKYPAH